jgi:hypothetical protein
MKHEQQKEQPYLAARSSDAAPESSDSQFFDGGWCWMTHPSRNDGNAIPVKMQIVDGVRYYYPFDPTDATDFEWDQRDDEWEIVSPATADSDAAFALDALRRSHAEMRLALGRCLNWLTSYPGGGAMGAYEQARAALTNAEKLS